MKRVTRPGNVELRFSGRLDRDAAWPLESASGALDRDDPTLLLERYLRLGEAFLDEVRGEYAVVVDDPRLGVRIAARDGLGNRYLGWRRIGGGVAFAASDAELAALAPATTELDRKRLAEYFAAIDPVGSETYFREVRAVLPGEMLVAEAGAGGALRRRQLARPRLDLRLDLPTWEAYVERFAELLGRAVERSLGDAERVAVWLSGGLDSSPLAAFAARAGRRVEGLVWQVDDQRGDETAFAVDVGRHLRIAISRIPCDRAWQYSDLAHWPVHPSTPGQTAYRWFHQKSYERAAELGCSLVLNGFGGDMLYANAKRWFWTLLAAKGSGAAIDRLREVAPTIGWWRTVRSQVLSPLLPKRRSLRRFLPAYLTVEARRSLDTRERWPPDATRARRPRQAGRLLSLLEAHGANAERHYAAPFGLDVRCPLRDHDLVEFMLAVPDHLLQQGEETRPVLRAAISGLVPESVRLRRTKAGFQSVLERGFDRENLRWAPGLLLAPDALWRGHVEEPAIRRWLEGRLADDWDRLGFLRCVDAELWRYVRCGGALSELARGD